MIGEKTRLKLTYADYLTTPEDKRYKRSNSWTENCS